VIEPEERQTLSLGMILIHFKFIVVHILTAHLANVSGGGRFSQQSSVCISYLSAVLYFSKMFVWRISWLSILLLTRNKNKHVWNYQVLYICDLFKIIFQKIYLFKKEVKF
jgi:hypothetical protein